MAVYTLDSDYPSFPNVSSMWLKPERWNQGGYDATFIDQRACLLRFAQVTISHKHDFKSEYFNIIDKLD